MGRGTKAGKNRRTKDATQHTQAVSGDLNNAKVMTRGGKSVVDGWRSQRPFRGADLDRKGNPLADPAVNLAWLDWCNRGHPLATGLNLPEPPPDQAAVLRSCPGLAS